MTSKIGRKVKFGKKPYTLLLKRVGSSFSKEPEFINQWSQFIPELFE